MHKGISIPPFTDSATLVDMAVDAEAAGWDGVFLWDHMQWDPQLGASMCTTLGSSWGRCRPTLSACAWGRS